MKRKRIVNYKTIGLTNSPDVEILLIFLPTNFSSGFLSQSKTHEKLDYCHTNTS